MSIQFSRNTSLLILSCWVSCPVLNVLAEPLPEYLSAEVAVQLKEDGRLTKEVHYLKLSCLEGECWLDTQVINRCSTVGQRSFQSPFSFRENSSDKNTKFRVEDNVVDITVESFDFGGKSLSTYRFVLSHNESGFHEGEVELRKFVVVDFSGGYVKDSNIVKRQIKVEFIPLRGKYVKVDLACPIEVPGIVGSRK